MSEMIYRHCAADKVGTERYKNHFEMYEFANTACFKAVHGR